VLDKNSQYQEMYGKLKARLSVGQDPGDLPEKMERQRKALAELYGGEPKVNTAGKIPESDIVFLDEIFKCNDGVLNSLLTALNERKYTNEGRTYPLPTISFFAASNEIPNFNDPQEKILEALYDRLELKVVTQNIEDRDKRLGVLRDKQAGRSGQIAATITLDYWKPCGRRWLTFLYLMLSMSWPTISCASCARMKSPCQTASTSTTTPSPSLRRGCPVTPRWSLRICWR